MTNLIVAFPNRENARYIKKILMQSGFCVSVVCTTGAQALQSAGELGGGIVICGYRLADMVYSELREYLPQGFELLLIASPANCRGRETEGPVCLAMPFQAGELVQTVRMMDASIMRRKREARKEKKVRTKEETTLIAEAKAVLMARNRLSEEEAHRYLQKRSMENGTGLFETAQMILSLLT
ncbi:MAG: ANTAR domain-containing protein [Roseburia sp.]|jgi:hypothetical protein|nr:ANTAR domain-containing protein [Roseburia sp.]